MKRLHVHVAVADIEHSTKFYSGLFGSEPTVRKDDYAKWMLEDPRVNFAISARGREPGLDHLGIQAENESELKDVSSRLKAANLNVIDEGKTTCCYAESDKAWVVDPQGIAWETFLTSGASTVYGDDNDVSTAIPMHKLTACCAPEVEAIQVELKRK
ncbi:MAG: glyoxalase/bleomycin resistance/dioxygenase family protein [Candidatus Melainabacteria bacterium]|jgi:catechol-2,3-dioxygenase|nr:MAG: glyoxalase/bleomycin resistance/dioxygenase family protein [Candidatus Melainabacteria bacterium]